MFPKILISTINAMDNYTIQAALEFFIMLCMGGVGLCLLSDFYQN